MTQKPTPGNGSPGAKHLDPTVDQIVQWLHVLIEPGSVVELRILGWRERSYPQTRSGYFDYDHLQQLAEEALRFTRQAEGVYLTPNPVNPALLARANNKTKVADKGKTTSDKDVLHRRWLLVDGDPARPAGIGSSAVEKELAHRTVLRISDYLRENAGWPAPILADSGNGGHLLYRVDLPAEDDGLIHRCLKALASKFDNDQVKVDTTVGNPARIWKLYGTMARKGDSTEDRPHRWARVLEIPAPVEVVQAELLLELANEAPAEAAKPAASRQEPSKNGSAASANGSAYSRLDVARWLTDRGVGFSRDVGPDGRDRYRLAGCPFIPEHGGKDTAIFQHADGTLGAKCFHNSCQGKGWQEFKQAIGDPGPEHYDPPLHKGKGQHVGSSADTPGQQTATPSSGKPARPAVEIFSAADLLTMDLPQPRWAVPGILPEGLAVLGGKPKLGKSWLALNLAIAVATGGYALGVSGIEQGPVLYLALEDGQRRLQDRLRKLLGSQPGPAPTGLTFSCRWPRQDKEGLAFLHESLEESKNVRLVVIDTWPLFRPQRRSKGGAESYEEDYNAAVAVKALADAYHCAILLIAHCRKGAAEDWQDELMGSQGLAGAADATAVLRRRRADPRATLNLAGRDVEEQTLHLQWRAEYCLWEAIEAPPEEEPEQTAAQQKAEAWMLQRVREAGEDGCQVGPLIAAGVEAGHAERTLYRARDTLKLAGCIRQHQIGKKKFLVFTARGETGPESPSAGTPDDHLPSDATA